MFICQLCGCSSENCRDFELLASAPMNEDGGAEFEPAEGWVYCSECVNKVHAILAILEHK